MDMTELHWRICVPIHSMNGCSFGVIVTVVNETRENVGLALTELVAMDYVDMRGASPGLTFFLTEKGKNAYYKWLGF